MRVLPEASEWMGQEGETGWDRVAGWRRMECGEGAHGNTTHLQGPLKLAMNIYVSPFTSVIFIPLFPLCLHVHVCVCVCV